MRCFCPPSSRRRSRVGCTAVTMHSHVTDESSGRLYPTLDYNVLWSGVKEAILTSGRHPRSGSRRFVSHLREDAQSGRHIVMHNTEFLRAGIVKKSTLSVSPIDVNGRTTHTLQPTGVKAVLLNRAWCQPKNDRRSREHNVMHRPCSRIFHFIASAVIKITSGLSPSCCTSEQRQTMPV